jgi:hypothetical protein
VLTVLWWQFALSFLVLMASIVLSPIPFLISEWLGIASASKTRFRWAVVALAPAFAAAFILAQNHASLELHVAAAVLGVLLNIAVFGAVYARSNFSSSGRAEAR